MIDLQLQLAQAKKLNLQASEEDVNFHMERLKEDNQLSDAQLQDMLQSRGMTMESYRKQIRESLLVSKVVNAEVRSRLVILETELQEAYEQRQSQYRVAGELTVSHILFLVPEGAAAEQEERAKAKAAEILQKLRAGVVVEFRGRIGCISIKPLKIFIKNADLGQHLRGRDICSATFSFPVVNDVDDNWYL